ncbi:MAG: 2-oxo acid dehydrogenase subunit E2 [Planctomycetaceae bacterium]|nr:2-oxo acid dehydrogenase subunit E2 [Planctomycetaceae bacterium]
MAIEFKLPQVSEGVTEADIAEVNVAEGDTIEPGQVVCVVETDKAAADIDCPHAGKVAKVHVKAGDTVKIGQTLLTIEASSDAPAPKKGSPAPAKPAAKAEASKPAAKAEPAKPAAKAAESPVRMDRPGSTSRPEPTATEDSPTTASPKTLAVAQTDGTNGRDNTPLPAAPSTRKLARELGVDLNRVPGTGPGGRITNDDVQSFVRTIASSNTTLTVAGSVAQTPALPDFTKFGELERVPMSRLAKTAAANLTMAWQTIPHVTQHDLADITELESARKHYMEKVGKNGAKITMTAIMIKAAVAALKAFPHFNSSIDMATGEVVYKKFYNIGVAVDTEFGLVVPVVRDADRKSVLQCAAELTEIAERARNRKLDMSDMQGGTFTITNLGGIGGTSFTPIVNYPEVAILGMSRSRWQLEIIDGKPEPRLMLPLSLSYDHRVINGADAARFVAKLTHSLSDFFQMLIE